MTPCPRCHVREREGQRSYCTPCGNAYARERHASGGGRPCPRCGTRLRSYGRPYCGPCRRDYEYEQRVARPPRPRCTRCGLLPEKRDGRCVMCAPVLQSPSLETYAQERRGEQG
jgi:hypothetical protein